MLTFCIVNELVYRTAPLVGGGSMLLQPGQRPGRALKAWCINQTELRLANSNIEILRATRCATLGGDGNTVVLRNSADNRRLACRAGWP